MPGGEEEEEEGRAGCGWRQSKPSQSAVVGDLCSTSYCVCIRTLFSCFQFRYMFVLFVCSCCCCFLNHCHESDNYFVDAIYRLSSLSVITMLHVPVHS